jgi:hypothetical protein
MYAKINIRWSEQARLITAICAVILIFAEVVLIDRYTAGGGPDLLVIIIIPLLLSVFILSAPLSITLYDSKLVLKKVFGRITVRYSQISSVRLYTPGSGDVRVFGSGGFCGYVGVFSNRKIGRYYSYVGDPKQAFLIRTKSGINYVFSCENVELVIETIKNTPLG